MKILIVSTGPVLPVKSGSQRFILDYCNMLTSLGYEVYYLWAISRHRKEENIRNKEISLSEMSKVFGKRLLIYHIPLIAQVRQKAFSLYHKLSSTNFIGCDENYPKGIDKYINDINQQYNFDACIVNYFWLSKLIPLISIPRKAIITHDCFTFYNLRNNTNRLLNMMPNEEAKYLQRCPVIFAMQDEEAQFFRRLSPKSKVLTNYCFSQFKKQKQTGNHNILYLSGSLYASINGIKWFIDDVFPLIKKDYKDSKLLIAGTICDSLNEYRHMGGIELLGKVDSADDFYAMGDVAINPTFQGSGLKIKTIESLSHEKVTIVHPHSTEGLFDRAESPLLSSKEPSEWLFFFHEIWDNPSRIKRIKEENKKYIERMNAFIISQFQEFLLG